MIKNLLTHVLVGVFKKTEKPIKPRKLIKPRKPEKK